MVVFPKMISLTHLIEFEHGYPIIFLLNHGKESLVHALFEGWFKVLLIHNITRCEE